MVDLVKVNQLEELGWLLMDVAAAADCDTAPLTAALRSNTSLRSLLLPAFRRPLGELVELGAAIVATQSCAVWEVRSADITGERRNGVGGAGQYSVAWVELAATTAVVFLDEPPQQQEEEGQAKAKAKAKTEHSEGGCTRMEQAINLGLLLNARCKVTILDARQVTAKSLANTHLLDRLSRLTRRCGLCRASMREWSSLRTKFKAFL